MIQATPYPLLIAPCNLAGDLPDSVKPHAPEVHGFLHSVYMLLLKMNSYFLTRADNKAYLIYSRSVLPAADTILPVRLSSFP